MNLIAGTIEEGGSAFVSQRGARLEFAVPPGIAEGRKIIVGLRPEHLQPAESGLSARVRLVEQTGAESHVLLEVGGETLTAVLYGRPNIRDDDVFNVSVPIEKQHFFDAESGARIAMTAGQA